MTQTTSRGILWVLVVLALASCGDGDATTTLAVDATTPTVAATSTVAPHSADDEPVAADQARVEITYTGKGTSYNGDRVIIEGRITMTFLNESGSGAVVALYWYAPGSSALPEEMEFLEEGEWGVPIGLPAEPYVEIELDEQLSLDGSGGLVEPGTHTWTQVLEPGTYIFDVGPEDFHQAGLWRAAVIEVVSV